MRGHRTIKLWTMTGHRTADCIGYNGNVSPTRRRSWCCCYCPRHGPGRAWGRNKIIIKSKVYINLNVNVSPTLRISRCCCCCPRLVQYEPRPGPKILVLLVLYYSTIRIGYNGNVSPTWRRSWCDSQARGCTRWGSGLKGRGGACDFLFITKFS